MFIDKIIVINLNRSAERKKRLLENLKNINVNLEDVLFLPAYDSHFLNDKLERTLYSDHMNRTFSKAEICCTLSHIFAIKISQSLQYKNILVLEDDVKICSDFFSRLELLES